jgi:hypothetical protein
MASFPYCPNAARVKRFFDGFHGIGKPEKVTVKWLEGLGFKTKDDRYLVGILKSLGFIDTSGLPTERWSQYRNKNHAPAVMAQAVRGAYPALFSTYPDAHQKDAEALRNFFSTHSDVGGKVLGLMVRTFKALVELADFGSEVSIIPESVDQGVAPEQPLLPGSAGKPSARGLLLNVNVQLQLPATDDAAVYDKLFEAMKKHLLT